MTDRWKRPTLGQSFAAIILVVLGPILGVVGMTILHAAGSYRDASTLQLQETAQVVARSTDGELDATARLLRGVAELQRHETDAGLADPTITALVPGDFSLIGIRDGRIVSGSARSNVISETAIAAATSGNLVLSDIMIDQIDGIQIFSLVAATPVRETDGVREVAVLVAQPAALIRSLSRPNVFSSSVVLAITDGRGRIIARSKDGERFVGRPVPDWNTLKSLDKDNGSFRAMTIEGNQIVFAFQAIHGAPGWMAVVGEPAESFDARWQRPIAIMVIASAVTIMIALLLASVLARQVLRPISGLVQRAQAIAGGASVTPDKDNVTVPSSFVAEFETLRTSLDEADAVLVRSLEESRQAEQKSRQSADAMRQAERLARIGSWTLDLTTGEFTSSDMLYELNGADPDGPPLTVDDLRRLLTPESHQRLQGAMSRCIGTGEPYALEADNIRVDGSSFRAYIQGEALRDGTGQVVRLTGTVQDISERDEERQRLAALADNLPSGVIFRMERNPDSDLRITYISAGIEKLVGLTPAGIVERFDNFIGLVVPEDLPELDVLYNLPAKAGQVIDREFRVSTRQRGLIWMHIRAALRIQSNGQLVWDGIARDITGEREAADALRAAKDAAEAAERAKSDFLATMSHEIRTPMNSVIGMTRLALQTSLDARQRNYLEKINGSANVLLGIINDILDFSRIEAGGLQLEGAVFSLESVLESVSAVTALKAEEKGLEFTFAVDPDTPTHFRGDALRLGQVLTNLVGNATKFTDVGDIVVSIRPSGSDGDRHILLEFSVRDTGIGLNEHQISGLFRPFSQAESDTSRKYGGTGLGLAICKRLVEMMGGEIRVESEPGKGSTFIFTARLEKAEPAETPAVAIRKSTRIGGRILIVDDNRSAREALAAMVAGFGMEVETAGSGATALAMLHSDSRRGAAFDIVLLDWRMPGLDGLETARKIKADSELPDMPAVLMVTGYGHEVVTQAVREIGLQGVLLKPVTQSVMFNTILGALTPQTAQYEPQARYPLPAGQAQIRRALAGRHVLVVDDNVLNREVATDFLEIVGIRVSSAVNGRDALDRLQGDDFDVVLMDMHMPVMNGLEAVKEIRKQPGWKELPVIALTAQAREEDHRASLDAGMTAHLTKPIDEVALYQTLIRVLGPYSRVSGRGVETAVMTGDTNVIDIGSIRQRLGGDERRVERLVRGFLRDFGSAPQQLRYMLEAGNNAELAELVHQIRGGAGYLVSGGLVEAADGLERSARRNDSTAVSENAPIFIRLLENCLACIEQALATALPSGEASAAPGSAALQAAPLIDSALPLVRRGDFAARELLEKVAAHLAKTPHDRLISEILDYYDDLEIDAAVRSLNRLKAELSGPLAGREDVS